ncbi:DMT family transporter [Herbaspirillum sp. SJZ107]|uniref:EamA family transporter n=1 Tax=Herbaspirillum sp. SJZ107 TaxID=2572881 RepID=UPI0011511922|nr:DMT family transporter [Herbaspirillum sp. SJZ107]TQK03471.1 inner membrane transporter RhtA [Herbaspirillum sp. SJZ107]
MPTHKFTTVLPALAILSSITFLGLGTSLAKHTLFPLFGAQGTTAIRVGFSAILLLVIWRPWRYGLSGPDAIRLVCYGSAMGLVTLSFYLALRTIPFGIAVAIEFAGPLTVALFSSRRPLDFVWVLLAMTGLGLLLPLGDTAHFDRAGVMYASAAAVFWAIYIVAGRQMKHFHAGYSVSSGLAVAALIVVPVGIPHLGSTLLSPWIFATALCVAVMSSAVPFTLEMIALKRLPPQVFAIMISMEPAVSAMLGLVLLNEQLSITQWLAIGLVVVASAGSSVQGQHENSMHATQEK